MPTDVPANFTIVTLGVADLERPPASTAIWGGSSAATRPRASPGSRPPGSWLGSYDHVCLAEDAGLEPTPAGAGCRPSGASRWRSTCASEGAVDLALARVQQVGGVIVKPATRAVWGGYSGYFVDPDGHLWEVAHAPGFTVDENGRIEIGSGD